MSSDAEIPEDVKESPESDNQPNVSMEGENEESIGKRTSSTDTEESLENVQEENSVNGKNDSSEEIDKSAFEGFSDSSPKSDDLKAASDPNSTPSITVTTPTGGDLTPSEVNEAPSIIVTSPSDGSLKCDYSPPPSPMTQVKSPTVIPYDPSSTQNDSILVDSDGEDYYEEYHLPNTHESAFVRHLSFRKKVQKTDINAPDAERIEGLVRTGEFVRHGSIRRRIVPEEEGIEEEDEYYYEVEEDDYDEEFITDPKNDSFSSGIERGVKEIEKYLSEENLDISYSDDNLRPLRNTRGLPKNRNLKRSSSTPVVYYSDTLLENDPSRHFLENAQSVQDMSFNEFKQNVTIEDSTLKKIKDCLDFSSYRNILNLSGKLTDLLSPKEVEEVLANSDRYRQYIDRPTEVFEALSLSYQANFNEIKDSTNSKSDSGSTTLSQNPDSGFSSPKTVTDDQSPVHQGGSIEDLPPSSLSGSSKLKISAPAIHLDSSTDSKLYESEDDADPLTNIIAPSSPGFDEEPLSYKRMISVTEGLFESGGDQTPSEDLNFASPPNFNRPRSDSMINLEDTTLALSSSPDLSPEPDRYTDVPPELCPPPPPDLIPELSAAEEAAEERHWRNVVIGGMWRRIDMKVIAPYKKSVTHGGYLDMEVSRSPVVVISAVNLPEKSRKDYSYVMDNLFMYVLSFVEQLAADDYVLVYLAGGRQTAGPGFQWMRKAYEMIDRRLRKNLKTLLVVHPSLWARTIIAVSRPFISSKFYRKIHFVYNLTELAQIISLDQLDIPDPVKQVDFEIMIKEKKKIRR